MLLMPPPQSARREQEGRAWQRGCVRTGRSRPVAETGRRGLRRRLLVSQRTQGHPGRGGGRLLGGWGAPFTGRAEEAMSHGVKPGW